jgi:hypothetical protein
VVTTLGPARIRPPRRSWGSPDLFDVVLADAGIRVVRTGVRMPRMNALMER